MAPRSHDAARRVNPSTTERKRPTAVACSSVVGPPDLVALALVTLCVTFAPAAHAAEPGAPSVATTDTAVAAPSRADAAARRVRSDAAAGRPIVVHVFVALADNESQGIVPIPRALGDGDTPRTNLYWGARYGVGHFLARERGWRRVAHGSSPSSNVLERIVLTKTIAGRTTVIVADAWRGSKIEDATRAFLRAAAGHDAESIDVSPRPSRAPERLDAGGAAHVIAWVGHDGLMDFDVPPLEEPDVDAPARSAIVLACKSHQLFGPPLSRANAHALLTTTQLMAPEAYALDAAIEAWVDALDPRAVRRAAARAYCEHQRCSERAGLGLFHSER